MGDTKTNANRVPARVAGRREIAVAKSMRADEYGELQQLVDQLYAGRMSSTVSKVDVVVRAEMNDLCDDLMEVIELLPAGNYRRARLCDQLNSIVTAHGWGYVYGTVS